MYKLTKQEALDQIEKLRQFVESVDNDVATWRVGDIFYSPSNKNTIIILPFGYNTKLYFFGGLCENPCIPYSTDGGKGLTAQQVTKFLKESDRYKRGNLSSFAQIDP